MTNQLEKVGTVIGKSFASFGLQKEVNKSQMKMENTTNISTSRLKQMIDFVRPNNLPTSQLTVKVTNSSDKIGSCGVCYSEGTGIGQEPHRPTIIARISRNETGYPWLKNYRYKVIVERFRAPHPKTGEMVNWKRKRQVDDPKARGGYINHISLSREEELLCTLAHEFRHFWQSNHKTKRGKVWGARGVFSERDACAYAIRKMREWRKLVCPREIYPHINWN